MIQVLRASSCMGRPRVPGGDLAEDVVEVAALDRDLLDLDQPRADEGGKLGGGRRAGLGRGAQPHPAGRGAGRGGGGAGGGAGARSRTRPLVAPTVSTLAIAANSESALDTASARPAA